MLLIRWLQVASALTALVGLVAAAGALPATWELWRLLFDVVAWPMDGAPASFDEPTRAMNAISGGVMFGWGLMMFALSSGPVAEGSRGAVAAMLYGVVGWFVVDSTASVAAGIPYNLVLNVSFLVLFLPPLLKLRVGVRGR